MTDPNKINLNGISVVSIDVQKSTFDELYHTKASFKKNLFITTHPFCSVLGSFEVTYQLDNYGWQINGTFDGVMGHMQREEVEFPSTGVFLRKDRYAVTSYAAATFTLR
jgi:hypothetical protein